MLAAIVNRSELLSLVARINLDPLDWLGLATRSRLFDFEAVLSS